MSLSVDINLNVPDLPDDDICFANAAAWKDYWSSINVTATFTSLNNTLYNEFPYDYSLTCPIVTGDDGNQYSLATKDQITSLLNAYNTLNTNYKILRNELKAAGLLTNSQ